MTKKGQGGGFAKKQAMEVEKRRAQERRRSIITLLGITAVVVIVMAVIAVLRAGRQTEEAAAILTPAAVTSGAEEDASAAADAPAAESDGYPGACEGQGELLTADRPLAELAPAERDHYYTAAPDNMLTPDVCYEAVLTTAGGEMRFRLFADETPLTVNNFVFLATQGYFDGTTFHRVLENFMAQGGDPTGTGVGGPGYQFADEVDTSFSFDRRGLLAMANAGPGTNGSQFFITFVETPWLDGNHTIFGRLLEGDDVLSQIRLRDPATDADPGQELTRVDIYIYP